MPDTNSTFQLRERDPADVENASSPDQFRIFLNALNGLLCTKDSAGVVTVIGGGGGSVATTMTSVVGPASHNASTQQTVLCNPAAGAITVNLPTAVGNTGLLIEIVNVTAVVTPITVQAAGGQNIIGDDGTAPTLVMNTPNERRYLRSNGTNAWIVTG